MKLKSIYAALATSAIVAGAYSAPASANVDIPNWQLQLPGIANNTGINQLNYFGESYIVNTPTQTAGVFTSTDTGVFNINGYNSGSLLNLGYAIGSNSTLYQGQLTGTYTATDLTYMNASTPYYVFTGGTFNMYFDSAANIAADPTQKFGASASNSYGAANGTLIASFTIQPTYNPNTGGGFLNANGGPLSNGTVSVGSAPNPTLNTNPYPFVDSTGNDLFSNVLLGFLTTNASLDTSANTNNYSIDPNLVKALSGTTGTANNLPTDMFISNGGQFKLQYLPEPATLALLGVGLVGIAGTLRRKSA